MKSSGDFCGNVSNSALLDIKGFNYTLEKPYQARRAAAIQLFVEKQAETDLQGSEGLGGSKSCFCTSESCICQEQQLQELSNCYYSIFEGEQRKKVFACTYSNAKVHLLETNGSLYKLWSCLKKAADDYLSKKATELTGLIGMDLIDALSALWCKYQHATKIISLCLSSSATPNPEASDLLLKAFQYNIILPEELNGCIDFDLYLTNRRPVHAIYYALIGTLTNVELVRPMDDVSVLKVRCIVQMLHTVKAAGCFELGSSMRRLYA
jgi:hypothetical protein